MAIPIRQSYHSPHTVYEPFMNATGVPIIWAWKEQKCSKATSNKREMEHMQGNHLETKALSAIRFQGNLQILSNSIPFHLSCWSLSSLLLGLSSSHPPAPTYKWPNLHTSTGPGSTCPTAPEPPSSTASNSLSSITSRDNLVIGQLCDS